MRWYWSLAHRRAYKKGKEMEYFRLQYILLTPLALFGAIIINRKATAWLNAHYGV